MQRSDLKGLLQCGGTLAVVAVRDGPVAATYHLFLQQLWADSRWR